MVTLYEDLEEIDPDPQSEIKKSQPEYQKFAFIIQIRKHDNVDYIS